MLAVARMKADLVRRAARCLSRGSGFPARTMLQSDETGLIDI